MLFRPKLACSLATLLACGSLILSGCSSKQPRDINYGTDVGVGYVPPDSSSSTTSEAGSSEAGTSEAGASDASVEVAADASQAVDGGTSGEVSEVSIDASVDQGD
jgi:hypothetical protein